MLKNFNTVPGFYAAGLYVNCQVVDAGLKAAGGDIGDKDKFMAALKAVSLTDTPRGPIKFDHFGNVVGTFFIRRCGPEGAKYGLKLWNKIIKTYENVSQFWTWPEAGVSRPSGLFARLSAAERSVENGRDNSGLYRRQRLRQ